MSARGWRGRRANTSRASARAFYYDIVVGGMGGRPHKDGAEAVCGSFNSASGGESRRTARCARGRRRIARGGVPPLVRQPEHEARWPRRSPPSVMLGVSVTESAEVSPQYREYESVKHRGGQRLHRARASGQYLDALSRGLADRGLARAFYLIQNNGGLATAVDGGASFPCDRWIRGPPAGADSSPPACGRRDGRRGPRSPSTWAGRRRRTCLIEDGTADPHRPARGET